MKTLFTYSWVDVTSVNLNSKKVLEDKIFGWQDILQFFSWASEDFKYAKSPYIYIYIYNIYIYIYSTNKGTVQVLINIYSTNKYI